MKAQVMTAFGAPLAAMDIEHKPPGPGEALVRVTHAGLCHSDLHIHDGYFDLGGGAKQPVTIATPAILGHEIVGEVAELGDGAMAPAVGARVAIYPWLGCGACSVCQRGNQQMCMAQPRRALGVAQWGGMADYVHVPYADALIEIGDLAPGFAATAMCSGLTAYSALKKLSALAPTDPIVLIGMGGVGMMALAIARATLPNPIVAIDVSDEKRAAALRLGAHNALTPDDAVDLTRRHGAVAAALDFVGAPQTFALGTAILRRGGAYIIVGLFGGAVSLPLATLALRPISIMGSYVGRLDEARALIGLLRTGAVQAPPMQERPLTAVNAALDDLRKGDVVGRIVLRP